MWNGSVPLLRLRNYCHEYVYGELLFKKLNDELAVLFFTILMGQHALNLTTAVIKIKLFVQLMSVYFLREGKETIHIEEYKGSAYTQNGYQIRIIPLLVFMMIILVSVLRLLRAISMIVLDNLSM